MFENFFSYLLLKTIAQKAKILIYESLSRKKSYDEEHQKFQDGLDNDVENIRKKLKLNCSFYLKRAEEKLNFLHKEAEDPFMSKHNLGADFRKRFQMIYNKYFLFEKNLSVKAKKRIEDWEQTLNGLSATVILNNKACFF